MSRWWRAYDQAVDDPKLQRLAPPLFKAWFNLMCLASANGGTLPVIGDVAFKLHVSEHKAAETIIALVVAKLIDRRPDGQFEPHNWNARQFRTDVTDPTNAERQKRFRDRHRVTDETVTEGVTVTPPREQRTDTDSEKKKDARERARYSPEFDEQVWQPYPRTPVMSKAEAWKAWEKATTDDQAAIIAAIPRYAAWLRSKPDHPAVHACRFITQRRFDGFGEPEPAIQLPPGKFYATADSDQLGAWDAHMRATRGRGLPRDRNGGWIVDAEWPPDYVPRKDEAA
jgi:hypothetical protein